MSILVDSKTRVVVQGITGRDGSFHTRQMLDYGTKVVAGVTPGKGGMFVEGVPVFNTVAQAAAETAANTSVIYVPPAMSIDAIHEAADAGMELVVCITEGVPANDMTRVYHDLKRTQTRLVGPNCPGVISPGQCKVGIMPGHIHRKGPVGVISRSGTLTYEVVYHLTANGIGQSTCIGIGGDPVIGTNFIDVLRMFEKDKQTTAVVLIGEIGGTDEEEAAEFINKEMTKPVVAFIAGRTAPPGKRMGHAGAIISGGTGTAADKVAAFQAVGVEVAVTPAEIATLVKCELDKLGKPRAIRVTAAPQRKAAKGAGRSASARAAKPRRRATAKTTAKKATKKAGKKATKKSSRRPKKTVRKRVKKTVKKGRKSQKDRPAKRTVKKPAKKTKKPAKKPVKKTKKPVKKRRK